MTINGRGVPKASVNIVSADQETIIGDGTTENPLRAVGGAGGTVTVSVDGEVVVENASVLNFEGVEVEGAGAEATIVVPTPPTAYIPLTAQASDPNPPGVDSYLWLDTSGTLFLVVDGVTTSINRQDAYDDVQTINLATNQTLSITTTGRKVLVYVTSPATISIDGLHVAGGNQNLMQVTIVCINNDSHGLICQQEGLTAAAADRFQNGALGDVGLTNLGVQYVYNTSLLRWVNVLANLN